MLWGLVGWSVFIFALVLRHGTALCPRQLKQTLRAEPPCTAGCSSSFLHSVDLRDGKLALVTLNTISSCCKSLAQANYVIPAVAWVIADPRWHAAALLASCTPKGENPNGGSKPRPHRRGCHSSKTNRSRLPWSLHRQCLHMFCWPNCFTSVHSFSRNLDFEIT